MTATCWPTRAKGISLLVAAFLGGMTFTEPDDVRELADGKVIATGRALGFTRRAMRPAIPRGR